MKTNENDAVVIGGMMMIDDDFPPMGDQSGLLPGPVQAAQPSRHGPAFPDLGAAAALSGSEPALPTQPRQRRYASISSFFRQDLSRTYLAHHELGSDFIIVIILIIIVIVIINNCLSLLLEFKLL